MLNDSIAEPLISVVLPSYNSEEFIEAAIESVLGQSYSKLRLILIDDGSSDTTPALIKKWSRLDDRVEAIFLEGPSGGPATPRNAGLALAAGDYVAFIDSDDIWHRDKLAIQLDEMCSNGLNFSSTLHIKFNDSDEIDIYRKVHFSAVERIRHDQLLKKNVLVASGVLLDADIAKRIEFSESPEFVAIEDYLAWLRVHQYGDIRSGIVLAKLVFYRKRADSISSSKIQMARKIFLLLSNYDRQGKKLGLLKYYYFFTYILGGMKTRYIDWRERKYG